MRWARRKAALRAIADVVLILPPFVLLPLCLIAFGRDRFFAMLPSVVFPLAAVFVAAVYLLTWKWRTDVFTEALHAARREGTAIFASPEELRIESDGPAGAVCNSITAAEIREIRSSPHTFERFWRSELPCLQIVLREGRLMEILDGYDEAELHAVAASVRTALRISDEEALNLR
jgi:hypothetical protein